MHTVIGYARLSAATEESTSIARQREIITDTARARGWHLLDIVEDPSASASRLRLNRPGLTRVREVIASGAADAVLVWRLDRIARSVVDFGILLDEGVSIISCTEPLDTTSAMGRAMAEILQVFAAMEARTISARVTMTRDYLRRNQRFPGGRRPYGYRTCPHPSGTGAALEIDPAEAAIVQDAKDSVLAGESLYSVISDLNARGVPTKYGGVGWRATTLQRILVSETLLGRVPTKGDVIRDADGLPLAVWPPILTVAESLALRRILAPQQPGNTRRRASRLLSGLATCGSCGRGLVVQKYTPPRQPRYRCISTTNGIPCPAPVSVDAAEVEEHVTGQFLALVGRWPVLEEVISATPSSELAEVEEAIRSTASAMTERGADLPALMARLADLQARRADMDVAHQRPSVELVETGQTFSEAWAARADDLPAQRALLSSAIDAVVIQPRGGRGGAPLVPTPERIVIEWRR